MKREGWFFFLHATLKSCVPEGHGIATLGVILYLSLSILVICAFRISQFRPPVPLAHAAFLPPDI